jgi:hypothetical protein
MFTKLFAGMVLTLGLVFGNVDWTEANPQPLCCVKMLSCCPKGPCCPK